MKKIELAAVQERFADIVWSNEPIASGELVKICEKELNYHIYSSSQTLREGSAPEQRWSCFFFDMQGGFLFRKK